MTEIIDKRLVGHHLQVMSPYAARTDHLVRLAAARSAQPHPRCGGLARIRSQKNSEAISEIPEVPENHRGLHPSNETAGRWPSGNRGNALIGGSVGKSATDRGLSRRSQIARMAEIAEGPQDVQAASVRIQARKLLSRMSASDGHETALTGGRKHRRIRLLTLEIADSKRHQSGVRRVSGIAVPGGRQPGSFSA